MQVEIVGLMLQCESAAHMAEWQQVIREAIPGFHEAVVGKRDEAVATRLSETVLKDADVQGWLNKRKMRKDADRWHRRWFALHQNTLYWFSGYYKVRGTLVLTEGTTLKDERFDFTTGTKRPNTFSLTSPEMVRAGLMLTLQAADDATFMRWWDALKVLATPVGLGGGKVASRRDPFSDGQARRQTSTLV
uniref:PH domain-containing protein n=1 Tax=Haptolina ericina TaxID=156174 RepID=A0A7S3FI57_9EUKA